LIFGIDHLVILDHSLGHTKIDELESPIGHQTNVVRFDVTMDHTMTYMVWYGRERKKEGGRLRERERERERDP